MSQRELTAEEMVSLNELKNKRRNLKSKLTRFTTFLNNATGSDLTQIKLRLEAVRPLLNQFEETINQINILENDDQSLDQEFETFESIYFSEIARATQIIENPSKPPSESPEIQLTETGALLHTPDSGNPGTSNIFNTNNANSRVRLPELDIPKFSGNYEDWPRFRDSFRAMIDSRSDLSNSEKLQYLQAKCVGDAYLSIKDISLCESNYEVAWMLLVDSFDNPRVVIQKHVAMLIDIPSVQRESASEIKELYYNINANLKVLKSLKQPVEHWDSLINHIIITRLPHQLRKSWEESTKGKTVPTTAQLLEFLRSKYQVLERSMPQHSNTKSSSSNNTKKQILTVTEAKEYCTHCHGEHKLHACEQFLKLSVSERYNAVKRLSLCFNCLRKGHRINQCRSSTCKKCHKRHHSLLHADNQSNQILISSESTENNLVNLNKTSSTNANEHVGCIGTAKQNVLSTALVDFFDSDGKSIQARIVLDPGSTCNLMTESLAKRLNLNLKHVDYPIEGFNQIETRIKYTCTAKFSSRQSNFSTSLEFLVNPQICSMLPSQPISLNDIKPPRNIRCKLADPEFYKPAPIDALFGIELAYHLQLVGQIAADDRKFGTLWQKTKLGWVLGGRVSQGSAIKENCYLTLNIHEQVERFWQMEEMPEQRFLSNEQMQVEKHFLDNTIRDLDGKYIVRLPFNERRNELTDSYEPAKRRFLSLENRFAINPTLKEEYTKFMREYEILGHMKKVNVSQIGKEGYFLPHHAVIKESSDTTKVRVVFDGSAKTKSGVSLNDALMVGPTIQQTLFDIIIRSRTHQIILCADVEKMYRMVKVHNEDGKYQRIIWRENPETELSIYELTTVTYGTASAPYLAVRVLHQIADDEGENFPRVAEITKRDFYVDDLITGTNTSDEAISLCKELEEMLLRGGFRLRQWVSNDFNVIHRIPENSRNIKLFIDSSNVIKTLGIQWNPSEDTLSYTIQFDSCESRVTKRSMLAQIAQLFDPIGLLAPVIMKAKILMQRLWQEKCDWDESISHDIHTAWVSYRTDLKILNNISFQRKVIIKDAVKIQLHGFCDASSVGYGACLYIRSVDKNGKIFTNLLCSKSRVAPLKPITIPRLELCSALLLSDLLKIVQDALCLNIREIFLWSDSSITLQWINTPAHLLKVFVANRVSHITNNTNTSSWRHVGSRDNPADFISRGHTPREFISNQHLWTHGPDWLRMEETQWPNKNFERVPLTELKPCVTLVVNDLQDSDFAKTFLNLHSSWNKTKRIMAYCLRFIHNVKSRISHRICSTSNNTCRNHMLAVDELKLAEIKILRLLQSSCFSEEIKFLISARNLKSYSLRSLNPFLDKDGLLRVGGRLTNSELNYNARCPIILPKNHTFTHMIIRCIHHRNFHSGIQATLNAVRENYWPINGLQTVKSVIHKCVKCYRCNPHQPNYLMGNLPKERITKSRPFVNVAVDYCGPFFIKEKNTEILKQ